MHSWLCSRRVCFLKSTNTGGCGLCIVSLHWRASAVVHLGWSRTLITAAAGKIYPSHCWLILHLFWCFSVSHVSARCPCLSTAGKRGHLMHFTSRCFLFLAGTSLCYTTSTKTKCSVLFQLCRFPVPLLVHAAWLMYNVFTITHHRFVKFLTDYWGAAKSLSSMISFLWHIWHFHFWLRALVFPLKYEELKQPLCLNYPKEATAEISFLVVFFCSALCHSVRFAWLGWKILDSIQWSNTCFLSRQLTGLLAEAGYAIYCRAQSCQTCNVLTILWMDGWSHFMAFRRLHFFF